MPVRLHCSAAGREVGAGNAEIYGLPRDVVTAVNLIGFEIEGGLLRPGELRSVDEEARGISSLIDTSKPTVISGRGPHWLYAVLVHNLHFSRALAAWEPRLRKGVVVEAPSARLIGSAVDPLTGEYSDESLGAEGEISLSASPEGGFNVYRVRIEGDAFPDPPRLRELVVPPPPEPQKPVVIEGLMPIWVGARLTAALVNASPALLIHDPRLNAAVVAATHVPAYSVGQVVERL